MNYFLILVILCLAGGGYYEYTTMEQQLGDQDTQIKKLQGENADLKTQLTQAASALLSRAPATANSSSAAATPAQPGVVPPASAPPATTNSNILGTVTTADGKTYANCRLLKVKASGIVVNDADGITEIGFMVMPPQLQQRFGYDPKAGANLSDDQVQADEGLRQAAKD